MITEIKTLKDVKSFTKHLTNIEKLSFHPDDDFKDYINFDTKKPFYSNEDAEFRNKLMYECFEVCQANKIDIYSVVLPILLKYNFTNLY